METVLIVKLATYCFSVLFLGLMGLWWNSDDAPNQFIKTFVITLFIIGTVLAIGMIRSGGDYHIGFYTVAVSSMVLSIVFMFAKSIGHWFNTLFKLLCLINLIGTITFFSI